MELHMRQVINLTSEWNIIFTNFLFWLISALRSNSSIGGHHHAARCIKVPAFKAEVKWPIIHVHWNPLPLRRCKGWTRARWRAPPKETSGRFPQVESRSLGTSSSSFPKSFASLQSPRPATRWEVRKRVNDNDNSTKTLWQWHTGNDTKTMTQRQCHCTRRPGPAGRKRVNRLSLSLGE